MGEEEVKAEEDEVNQAKAANDSGLGLGVDEESELEVSDSCLQGDQQQHRLPLPHLRQGEGCTPHI